VVEKDILRAAVYGCSDFFDWFSRFKGVSEAFEVQKLGGVIAEGPIIGPAMLNFPRRRLENLKCRDQAIGPGWAGTFIKHTMVRECKRLGVEIYTEHRAVQLLTGERGEINGVLADDPGGRTRINCKSCIIATGGMGRSDEKLKKYFPDFFDDKTPILRFSVPTDTGDGIDLAEPLGARIPRDRMYCSVFGPAHHPFSYVIYRFMRRPECVYINLKGKRWLNEELEILGGMHSIHLQPRAVSFGVMSQRMVDAAADFFINDPMARQEAWIFKDYQRDLDEETALGFPVRKGATLEELALKMEVDPGVFTAEIQRYNRMCAEGRDEDFGKDPRFLIPLDDEGPYYGFYGQRFSEGTFGGLAVNPATEVINQDGKSIPGLYGVGDATSAVQVRGNLAVVSELTWATASAYLAGANTAAFCDTEGGKRSNYESRH
jgi:fumarate reductase flavoprotein subunit